MIDIHCHILPDFDDGASGIEESLEMARMAYRSGVTDIAATSHFMGTMEGLERLPLMRQRYTDLVLQLRKAEIPIRLHPGAEILCTPQTPELAQLGRLPTLGSGNYVLTEFFFDESFDFMDTMLADIAAEGYRIVVAHPERYGAIQHDIRLLHRWARLGYVLQLNKGSVLGAFGSGAKHAANAIMDQGLAHLFASDAHSYHSRTPHMSQIRQWVGEHCDQRYAQILLERNPRRILEGRPVVGAD
jgi:protein-tyrosine phosphatase